MVSAGMLEHYALPVLTPPRSIRVFTPAMCHPANYNPHRRARA